MEEWEQPSGKEDSYQIGDRVQHSGATWESNTKDNESEPGTDGTWTLIEDSLRNRAIAAYEDQTNATETDARAVVLAVTGPEADDNLNLAHREMADTYSLMIFSDGDISLAARKRIERPWEVRLVEDRDGWTELSGDLESLVDLGEALAVK